jgi:hypothetical protein
MREPNWPKDAIIAHNAYLNQFEIPVLFYVLTILALITKQADLLFVIMAWIFVVMRYLQVGVFLTTNHVPIRGAFFGIGVLVLVIMWIIYIIRILTLSWI